LIGLGCLATGMDGNEKLISPQNLERDLKLCKEAGISEEVLTDEVLSGQTALIMTEGDSVAPIQIVGKFAKENNL